MSFVVSREGGLQLLTDLLGAESGEDWLLGLYNVAITPTESDAAATYTSQEASFPGYSRRTLTRSISPATWSTPILRAPSGSPAWSTRDEVASSSYGDVPASWSVESGSETVHGYFIVGAESGVLILAERFANPRTLHAGDTFSIQPTFEVG